MMSLSIITPTVSRPTLARALASATLRPFDEWIVVGDGPQPEARQLVEELGHPYRYLETEPTCDWGNAQRQMGMEQAQGFYLLFLDDDDEYLPGALEIIRRQLTGMPFIFRAHRNGEIIWKERRVVAGNVGHCFSCVPNLRSRLPRWGYGYNADFEFVSDVVESWGIENIVWAGEVIMRYGYHA